MRTLFLGLLVVFVWVALPLSIGTDNVKNLVQVEYPRRSTNTRTPYLYRGNDNPSASRASPKVDGYVQLGAFVVFRHGSRNPKASTAAKVHQTIDRWRVFINNAVHPATKHRLQYYHSCADYAVSARHNLLNPMGAWEMASLASRYRDQVLSRAGDRNPATARPLDEANLADRWEFVHSGTDRTEESAQVFKTVFLYGLGRYSGTISNPPLSIGEDSNNDSCSPLNYSESPSKGEGETFDMHLERGESGEVDARTDALVRKLKPYAASQQWIDYVLAKPTKDWLAERRAPIDTILRTSFEPMLRELGMDPLTFDVTRDLIPLYDLCSFELATAGPNPDSCLLFSERDLLYLEYRDDLENYVYYGPGCLGLGPSAYPAINQHLAYPLLEDIEMAMTELIRIDQQGFASTTATSIPQGKFYFSHARLILLLGTLLDLYRDDEVFTKIMPTETEILNRRFSTSALAPMAANLGFELWRRPSSSDYYVRVTHNERTVVPNFPACSPTTGLCQYRAFFDQIRSLYGADNERYF
ncbi:hypothetical protein IWQ60_001321 [Tieghemiomyces parasiticus]|uniref:Multiple inositol polyphosphate phosphatase 1 n=1 Tax=Tieghemiomyces parasiticus TaxID=78921 RepID=A0A9W8AEV2_9FUNG|nr:hypothetical protein IWQ60_001321 [Tieghemiomyces parasiticus]